MNSQDRARLALVAVLVFAIVLASSGTGFAAGWYLAPQAAPAANPPREDLQQRFGLFWEAWSIIEREYNADAPLDLQKMVYGAISGAINSLGDPYTTFSEPAQARIFEEDLEGSFEGIGATVDLVEGLLVIVEPLESSPALKAGLRPNDVILEVDGQSLQGLDLTEAISLIRGPKGTRVRLLIHRPGMLEPFEVELTRDKIDLPTVSHQMLEDGIAYVRLTEFNNQATTRLRAALRSLMEEEPRALIFDLRGNPGGYLHIAVQVASQFIREGVVVIEKNSKGEVGELRADGRGLALDVPLVVLVDGGTASASEIVAGAIQDLGRGTLIGRPTYGKGSVQASYTLSDGSAVRVSIARWYTPNGHQLDGDGLTPDIVVEPNPEQSADDDPVLERARQFILAPQAEPAEMP
jgi:carboxyl-terminal processing protease